jgi:hypothetical protein
MRYKTVLKILGDSVAPDGTLGQGKLDYISWWPEQWEGYTATLDGQFTADELIAIGTYMKQNLKKVLCEHCGERPKQVGNICKECENPILRKCREAFADAVRSPEHLMYPCITVSVCPACKERPIAPGRETCVECSH